jgi:DNA-binding NtrC family response regulator
MPHTLPLEVLVLEDHPLIRINVADALADSGIMAWEAGDALEALRVLDEHPRIGLIFADVDLPGDMDGLAFASVATGRRPDLGVIITSGSEQIPPSQIPDNGDFLPKPYGAERLVALVRRKLG